MANNTRSLQQLLELRQEADAQNLHVRISIDNITGLLFETCVMGSFHIAFDLDQLPDLYPSLVPLPSQWHADVVLIDPRAVIAACGRDPVDRDTTRITLAGGDSVLVALSVHNLRLILAAYPRASLRSGHAEKP